MQQGYISVKDRYEKFLATVCETNRVYALESEEGFATTGSADLDDEDGEPVGVVCYWSEEELAGFCIKKDWAAHRITEVTLSEFIENWCVGMNNDGLLAGINFDQNHLGREVEPLELILELIKELKARNSGITFLKFDSLSGLEKQIKAANR